MRRRPYLIVTALTAVNTMTALSAAGLMALISSTPAKAASPSEMRVTSLRTISDGGIQGLELRVRQLSPKVLLLYGRYSMATNRWALVINRHKLRFNSKGIFQLKIPANEKWRILHVSAVAPTGESQREIFQIQNENHRGTSPIQKSASATPAPATGPSTKPHLWSLGIGPTLISYQETALEPLTELAMSGKISYLFWLSPGRWNLGVNAYATLLPLYSNPSHLKAKFIGTNIRAGYVITGAESPWRITLAAGAFFTLMPVQDFGFQGLSGPQLYPVIQRNLVNGHSMGGYFKFSPIAAGFGIQNLSSREIASGLNYTLPVGAADNGKSITVSIDAADLRFQAEEAIIQSKSVSLGLGYNW